MKKETWSLNHWIVLLTLGGYLSLLLEVRYHHHEILSEYWYAWVPIYLAAAMLVAGVLGLAAWNTWGRKLLMAGYAISIIVGLLGVYFHSDSGEYSLLRVFTIWSQPLPQEYHDDDDDDGGPAESSEGEVHVTHERPALAPSAYVGLGLIGLLVCLPQFQRREDS